MNQLGRSDTRWPDPQKGPWTIRATWAEVDGRPECVGLELYKGCRPLTADPPELEELPGDVLGAIQAAELRTIPVGELVGTLRSKAERGWRRSAASLRRAMKQAGDSELYSPDQQLLVSDYLGRLAKRADRQIQDFGRKGRGRYPDGYWRAVAEVYSRAWEDGENPTKAVAAHFKIPYSTATKHVIRARAEGHLGPVARGRRGGVIIKKAR